MKNEDNNKPTYKAFTAYQLEEDQWGFFVDEKCRTYLSPFKTKELAQKEADFAKDSFGRPVRFTAAWKKAIEWISTRTGADITNLVCSNDFDSAKEYQDLRPNIDTFKRLMSRSRGIRIFAVQAFSFYNTSVAVDLAGDELSILTPLDLAAYVDEDGQKIITDLIMNYAGW